MKSPKASFYSIPGNPLIPAVVRAYGTIIRVASIMLIILVAVGLLLLFIEKAQQSPTPGGTLQIDVITDRVNHVAVILIIGCIPCSILFHAGKLVRNGHKTGIHALTALATLGIISVFIPAALAWQGGWIIGMVTIVAVTIGLVPTILVAHKHWEKFH